MQSDHPPTGEVEKDREKDKIAPANLASVTDAQSEVRKQVAILGGDGVPENEIVPPIEVLERALSYMAVRWLTIGSPMREKVSQEYCSRSPEDQGKGVSIRRVKQRELLKYFGGLVKEIGTNDAQNRIDNGDFPEEFLLPEEQISNEVIKTMKLWTEESFMLGRIDFDKWNDNFWKAGPLRYIKAGGDGHLGLPHQIAKSVENNALKKFYNELERYAGHPWFARDQYFFCSPKFGDGMSDSGAFQMLYLFQNGSFVHRMDNGKRELPAGVYVSPTSNIDFYAERSAFPPSAKKLTFDQSCRDIPVTCLQKDSIFVLDNGQVRPQFYERGSVICRNGILISSPESSAEEVILTEDGKEPIQTTYGEVARMMSS